MLTDTMNHEEVIREIEKDLPQVWNYFVKKDFDKILNKKIGKRKKLQDPIEYKELYTSKNNIEWGIHLIAVEPKVKFYAIYALHRCKNGIAAYKALPESGKCDWAVYSAHFFDQYYKRFLQDEYDEPLHKKEVIQDFMLYNPVFFDFSSRKDNIEGLLSKSSKQRLEEEGSRELMCAIDDGIYFGFIEPTYAVHTTFISYDMVREDQEMLVDYLQLGLVLGKKGFDLHNFTVHVNRTFYYTGSEDEIITFLLLELMLGISPAVDRKLTEEEAKDYIINIGTKEKQEKRDILYGKDKLTLGFNPTDKLMNVGKPIEHQFTQKTGEDFLLD